MQKLGGGKFRSFTRDKNLDVAKGLGILLVVWGHCSQFLFNEIYAFHMPLFFFLSGCVLNVDKPYKEIIKKKVNQLLLPYVFFVLLSCIFYWSLLILTNRFEINDLLSITSLFPYDNEIVNTPLWFLFSLFWMSVFYLGIRKLIPYEWCISVVVLIFYFGIEIMKEHDMSLPFFIGRGLGEMVYMHCGYFLYKKRGYIFQWYKLTNKNKVLLFLLGVAIYFILFDYGVKIFENEWIGSKIVLLLIAFLGIFITLMSSLLCSIWTFLTQILCYLGRNTLYIFAVHLPLLECVRPIGKYIVGEHGLLYDAVVFCGDLLLAIIVSHGLKLLKNRFLERRMGCVR